MGIRIYKALGYTNKRDLKYNRKTEMNAFNDLLETTINEDFFKNNPEIINAVGELYLENNETRFGVSSEEIWRLTGPVFLPDYSFEHDLSTFLHFLPDEDGYESYKPLYVPLGKEDWHRYDDIIDWVEESGVLGRQVDLTKQCGIFPHTMMTRMRLPEDMSIYNKSNSDGLQFINPTDYKLMVGWEGKRSSLTSEKLLKHLLEDYRPVIPIEVYLQVYMIRDYLDIDIKDYINELRPYLVVWWH